MSFRSRFKLSRARRSVYRVACIPHMSRSLFSLKYCGDELKLEAYCSWPLTHKYGRVEAVERSGLSSALEMGRERQDPIRPIPLFLSFNMDTVLRRQHEERGVVCAGWAAAPFGPSPKRATCPEIWRSSPRASRTCPKWDVGI